jgi:formimidoylglutamate deiminase
MLESSQRLRLRVRNVASSEAAPDVATNLWRAAAEGGAQAIGQPVGSLAAGRRADFVVLDGADVDFESIEAPDALAVSTFAGDANRVRDVFVAGRCVVDDRHHAIEEAAGTSYRSALERLRAKPHP